MKRLRQIFLYLVILHIGGFFFHRLFVTASYLAHTLTVKSGWGYFFATFLSYPYFYMFLCIWMIFLFLDEIIPIAKAIWQRLVS